MDVDSVSYLTLGRVPSESGNIIQTIRMCDGFARAGYDTVLCYPRWGQPDPEYAALDIDEFYGVTSSFSKRAIPYIEPVHVPALFGGRLRGPVSAGANLAYAVTASLWQLRINADLYVTRHWQLATGLVALGLPTVFEIHKVEASGFGPRARQVMSRLSKTDHLRAVVTLTDETAAALTDAGFPAEKLLVEPDAVDVTGYDESVSRERAREHIDLTTDRPVVGYTGSFARGKGARVLAAACRDSPVTVLMVGGSDPERASMREYLRREGIDNVELRDRVLPAEIRHYQWAADVLALPATARHNRQKHQPESTSPLKMFEYMAAQRPVVATRLPGIEDVLTDEHDALLVRPSSEAELRDAVERLVDDRELGRKLAKRAREHVADYTWKQRAARIVAFAERDCDKSPR